LSLNKNLSYPRELHDALGLCQLKSCTLVLLYYCAAMDKISTDSASRGPSATAELNVK